MTAGIVAPTVEGVFGGLGVGFSLGAAHKLERGAIIQEITAIHMTATRSLSGPSVSTQIALLRRLLLRPVDGPSKRWFQKVTNVNLGVFSLFFSL